MGADLYSIISLAALGILSIAIQWKGRTDLLDFVNLLIASTIVLVVFGDQGAFESPSINWYVYGTIGLLAVNFVLSRISLFRKGHLGFIPALLTVGGFVAMISNSSYSYGGFEGDFSNKLILSLAVFGVIIFDVAKIKQRVVDSIFSVKETSIFEPVQLLLGALAVFGAVFGGSYVGMVLLAIGYVARSFYQREKSATLVYSLLAVSLLGHMMHLSDLIQSDILLGKVLAGLFIGAGGVKLIAYAWSAEKRKLIALGIGYLAIVGLALVFIYNGAIYAGIGGMDAFIGFLIGFALMAAIEKESMVVSSLFGLTVSAALIVPAFMVNEELEAFEQEFQEIEQVEELPDNLPLADIAGNYSFDESTSSLSFKLGPQGSVTKGAIKNFSGSAEIAENLSESKVTALIPVTNLTTFVSMRDKEIMGDAYLNESKFPKMEFTSSGWKVGANNTYQMTGDFTMLGVKKTVEIEVTYNEQMIFDRSK